MIIKLSMVLKKRAPNVTWFVKLRVWMSLEPTLNDQGTPLHKSTSLKGVLDSVFISSPKTYLTLSPLCKMKMLILASPDCGEVQIREWIIHVKELCMVRSWAQKALLQSAFSRQRTSQIILDLMQFSAIN